jgi:hypothetical protein
MKLHARMLLQAAKVTQGLLGVGVIGGGLVACCGSTHSAVRPLAGSLSRRCERAATCILHLASCKAKKSGALKG